MGSPLYLLHSLLKALPLSTPAPVSNFPLAAMVDWVRVNARLPYGAGEEARQRRREVWEAIDVNDNGYASLSEVTRVRHDVT